MTDYLPFEDANANRLQIDWVPTDVYKPKEKKLVVLKNIDIRDLEEYIDWNILFNANGYTVRYPKILNHPTFAQPAQKLLDEAKTAINTAKQNAQLQIDALFKVWPANATQNSISIENKKFHFLRQQGIKKKVQPNYCLSDFIAPNTSGSDYLGTYILSVSEKKDEAPNTLLKSIKNLLLDAARKYLHLKIRTEYWAYAKREKLTTEDILKHKYQGIIIPMGHAALPTTEAEDLLASLLNAETNLGQSFTQNLNDGLEYGLCFAHPQAKYFGTGKLGTDQINDFKNQLTQSGFTIPSTQLERLQF